MSLARVHDPLGNVIIRQIGDAGGPRSDWVADELNQIITAHNAGFGIYFADVAARQTGANTTETDFSTKTVLANTLANNGDMMLFASRTVYAANANTKRYRVYWDSTVLFDSGAVAFNGVNQFLIGLIYRENSTTLSTIFANIVGTAINPAVSVAFTTTTSFTVNRTLKTTGQNGAASAGDIIQAGLFVMKGSV